MKITLLVSLLLQGGKLAKSRPCTYKRNLLLFQGSQMAESLPRWTNCWAVYRLSSYFVFKFHWTPFLPSSFRARNIKYHWNGGVVEINKSPPLKFQEFCLLVKGLKFLRGDVLIISLPVLNRYLLYRSLKREVNTAAH